MSQGPAPNPVENELEASRAPAERATWETALDRYEEYRRYLLDRASPATGSEAALLARYQQAEQTAWDAYRSACRANTRAA